MTNAIIHYTRFSRAEAAYDLSTILVTGGWSTDVQIGSAEHVLLRDEDGLHTVTWDEARKIVLGEERDTVKIELLSDTAKLPTRGSPLSAGLDLYYAGLATRFYPGDRRLLSAGILVECPPGHYIRIAPRSGMSLKGFDVGAGVVDEDFRGEIKVLLSLQGVISHTIEPGDRIAQMIFERCSLFDPVIGTVCRSTTRGASGYGSTGR